MCVQKGIGGRSSDARIPFIASEERFERLKFENLYLRSHIHRGIYNTLTSHLHTNKFMAVRNERSERTLVPTVCHRRRLTHVRTSSERNTHKNDILIRFRGNFIVFYRKGAD